MNCRVDRDPKGNILKVYDQDGNESQLFMELAQVPGTTLETALEQYISTLEPELEFSRVDINNGLTSHMFTLGDDKVGSIRTKPFKDGVKVDQAIVKEDYRGQGVGTELYLETIRNLMVDGKKLYSDTSRTEFAERIWERLVSQRLAVKNEDGTYETVSPVGNVTEETTIDEIIESLSTDNSIQLKEIGDKLIQNSVVKDFHLLSNEEMIAELVNRGINEDLARQVVAYHGSPHKFDRFLTEFMGTGEGAQAFGWGLYFTELESIAREYARMNSSKANSDVEHYLRSTGDYAHLASLTNDTVNIEYAMDERRGSLEQNLGDYGLSIKEYIGILERQLEDNKKFYDNVDPSDSFNTILKQEFENNLENVENVLKEIRDIVGSENLYKVTIHKGKQPSEYTWLEWDKPANNRLKQLLSNSVSQSSLSGEIHNIKISDKFDADSYDGGLTYRVGDTTKMGQSDEFTGTIYNTLEEAEEEARRLNFLETDISGKDLYEALAKELGQKQASLFLLENGIDGVKYPAESISSGATSDNARGFNYVVFDEKAVTIEEAIQFQKELSEKGVGLTTAGFYHNGEVFLNKEVATSNTVIHEFAHPYITQLKERNPEMYAEGIQKLQEEGQDIIDWVKERQPNLTGDALLEEALVQAVGNEGERLLNESKHKGLKAWIQDFWNDLKTLLGLTNYSTEVVKQMTLKEYSEALAVDVMRGSYVDMLNGNSQAIRRNNGNPLNLAPNGKPSILYQSYKDLEYSDSEAERLTAQVYSDEFMSWFGDWINEPQNASKVVDENGQPLLVLHGTRSNSITVFDRSENIGRASGLKEYFDYFTTNKKLAETYATKLLSAEYLKIRDKKIKDLTEELLLTRNNRDFDRISENIEAIKNESKPTIYEVFLNIRNPFTFDGEGLDSTNGFNKGRLDLGYKTVKGRANLTEAVSGNNIAYKSPYDGMIITNIADMEVGIFGTSNETEIKEKSKDFVGEVFASISPNQIKSATSNTGEFSTTEPNIYYRVGEAQTESYKEALDLAQGQDIQVGVIKNGEFQPLETRSSNLNPTTPIGWVNNVVAEGIVKETQYIENGQARLEVEGDSAIKRVINEEIVKDFALENDMKAEINEDGTFTISSLGVPDSSTDKVVYEQVYDNFFGQQTAQGVFIETDSQLVDKITSFLEKLGFSMVSIEAYKQKYLDKNGVLPNAEALVDLANQVVAFKDGKITEDALTEEFAHIIIEGLPIEEIQPLLDQVHETKEWADHAETYQQIYKNDVLVRKEILGKIVANGLQQKTKAQNIFQSAWASIKNFINSIIRPGFESDVSNLTDRVHDMLVRQDASSLEDLSKRKFRMYRVDNTMPDLVRTALNQIEEGERQLRTSGSDKYLISEAYNNIDQGRSDLAVVNMLDLAKRQARYVRQALDSASVNGSLLSGEERVVANNLKTVIQPIISRIRIEAENDTKLSKYLQHAKEVSDDISMLDTSVSDQVIDDLIDDLFVSNPDLHNQTFDGKSARDYFRDAFKVAESDTNYLFSMIGSIAHAKDALLGMLTKVLKNMTMRAHFKFHDSATAFNSVLEKAGFLPKDLKKFYHKDGYMLSAWDWAEYNIKLNEAKKSALQTAGITYEGDFDPKTNYVADATPDQATVYRDTLMKLRSEFETKKYNQEYYDKMDAKMKSLNLSQKTMDRITAFGLERSHIMRDVKRDEKGRPIFTKRDTEALEAYNIERRRAKSFYDSEGNIKDGIKAHMEEVSDSLEVGGLFYTLDKDAGEDAITAFEMVKYDRASAPSSSHSGISQFLDIMKDMSVSQAKEYAKANINMNPVYEDFTPLEIKDGFEVEYDIYKKLSAQRKSILNRYRDPKNASNILFHQMDKAIQAKVRDLSENIAVQRRKIEFQETDVADSRNEYGVNEAYKAWVKEEGFGANPQLEFEAALEHVPLHQKAYLNGLFNSLDLLLRGYEISSLENNRLNKEFGDLDFKQLSEEDIQIEKLESVKKRLAPYFMASVPASMNTKLDALNSARDTDQVIRVLKDLDNDPAVNMSMHYSFYEDVSADLNPEYNQNYKGGPVQPKMRNLEFEKLLNIAPGTYTLDDLGIPVMKQGYSESNDLIVYRALIEMNHQNLTLQGEAGHTNVFQAPQVSRTTTDKIMSVLAGDTKLLDTAKEMINEMKNFRIDDMMIGEVDGNGEALAKQGIRIVPKRFVRQLETTADVTDDLFFSMMLMNKESHLHKARKESVNQVMALDQAMTNRKYNNTSKQAQSTNSYKMFKSFVDSNMFGITEVANYKVNLPFVGSVDLAKVSKLLHQYVRNRNLAYNLVVPMTSWVTAEVGLLIEGWVKQYVDQGSLMGARKELARLTPNAFTESMDIIKTSKLSVIAERFDLFNMETSYQNAKYGAGIRSIGKVGYVAHTGANFSPIMTAMLGSLIGHRLYNGQFLNYDEFKSQVRTERNLSSKEADAEWAASQDQSFYNYIDAKDGQFNKKYQKFADDTGVELEQAKAMLDRYEIDIAIKTQKLSEVIDGNIRPEERSIAQRHFLLSFLTTHKGWMSIALARRFKDGHYNTSTNKWEEGHYMTGFRASKMMLKSLLDSKGNPNQVYKQILEDWKNAKPEERMNMQRMLIEMGVLTGLYTLLLMLTGFADDDENKDVSSIQFTAYIMERLVNETRSSQLGLGNEILNTIQDPVVGFKELRKLADISQLFDSEEVLRGRYQGLSGTSAYLLNAVPGGKAMHTISTGENIYYQRNAYKLYNSPDELQPLGLIIDTGDVNEIYGN